MILFCTDLDNTLIYSYKHKMDSLKKCVEIYQGREISFMTEKSIKLLMELLKKVLIIPTTTRTTEQYERIELGFKPKYALTCNGGILLENGEINNSWYKESLNMIKESVYEMQKALRLLDHDEDRCFELRYINDLFIFTKSENPMKSIQKLSLQLDLKLVDVFQNGAKVYVVPKKLTKGTAVLRIKQKTMAEKLIVAGDSDFDISMLEVSDVGFCIENLLSKPIKNVFELNESNFTESLLTKIGKWVEENKVLI